MVLLVFRLFVGYVGGMSAKKAITKKPVAKRGCGQPRRDFTKEKQQVLDLVAEGKSVRKIAKMDGMPTKNQIFRWEEDDPIYWVRYIKALVRRADYYVDTCMETAERTYVRAVGGSLQPGELAAATIYTFNCRWAAATLAPLKYGRAALENAEGSSATKKAITVTFEGVSENITEKDK